MNLDLSGRTALVGGASRGIGRASARVLAGMGARVIATGRTGELLDSLLGELAGPVAHASLVVDYDDPDAVVAAVQEHLADGPINILVNNTGGPPGGPLIDFDGQTALRAQVREARSAEATHNVCMTNGPRLFVGRDSVRDGAGREKTRTLPLLGTRRDNVEICWSDSTSRPT